MAQVLTAGLSSTGAHKQDTRFWAVDKVILAYFAASVVLILGWWSSLPAALPLLAANLIGGAAIVYQVKRPNPLRGYSGTGTRFPSLLPVTRKWLCSYPRSATPMRTNGWPIWISESGARTRPSGWSAFTRRS